MRRQIDQQLADIRIADQMQMHALLEQACLAAHIDILQRNGVRAAALDDQIALDGDIAQRNIAIADGFCDGHIAIDRLIFQRRALILDHNIVRGGLGGVGGGCGRLCRLVRRAAQHAVERGYRLGSADGGVGVKAAVGIARHIARRNDCAHASPRPCGNGADIREAICACLICAQSRRVCNHHSRLGTGNGVARLEAAIAVALDIARRNGSRYGAIEPATIFYIRKIDAALRPKALCVIHQRDKFRTGDGVARLKGAVLIALDQALVLPLRDDAFRPVPGDIARRSHGGHTRHDHRSRQRQWQKFVDEILPHFVPSFDSIKTFVPHREIRIPMRRSGDSCCRRVRNFFHFIIIMRILQSNRHFVKKYLDLEGIYPLFFG